MDPGCPPAQRLRHCGDGKDQARAEDRRSPRRPLPTRRQFVSLASVDLAGLPRDCRRRVDPFSVDGAHKGSRCRISCRYSESADAARLGQLEHSCRRASGILKRGDRARTARQLRTTSRERSTSRVSGCRRRGPALRTRQGSASAVRLFVERAKEQGVAGLSPSTTHRRRFRICRLVDGMSLGSSSPLWGSMRSAPR